MTRQKLWRVLIVVFTLTIMGASLNSLAQSVPGQIEDLDGTLLSNNLALPAPLQVPLPLRFEALSVLGGNPPSAITSSTPLPSSLPSDSPSEAVSAKVTNSPVQSSNSSVDLAVKPSSNSKPNTSSTNKPNTSSTNKPSLLSTATPKSSAKPARKTVVKPRVKLSRTTTSSRVSTLSTRSGPSFFLKSTGYNSSVSQTDSSPRVTATGARTRFGVIALSRDMLGSIPYGSQVRLEDMGALGSGAGRGRFNSMLRGVVFIVEDTMNKRISRTVDVWFHSRSTALRWGKRQVKLTILRYGRR
jgi:3D (Asp-Asp-Asp) domain-containing protein